MLSAHVTLGCRHGQIEVKYIPTIVQSWIPTLIVTGQTDMNASHLNATSDQDALFWILLVEDEVDVLRDLSVILGKALPRSGIHAAPSVEDARDHLEFSRRRGIRYDLALLDFKVPLRRGMHEEVDFSLCEAVQKMRVPIIHFSAYAQDETIQAHMESVHRDEALLNVPVIVDKNTRAEFSKKLVAIIQPYFQRTVSERIDSRLSGLFGLSGADSSEAARAFRVPTPSGSATHTLIALQNDIMELWPFLGPDVRGRVRNVFSVVELDGASKRLSLF